MPCNCDYMEPTLAEQHRREAATLLVYVKKKLGQDIPVSLNKASKHIYGEGVDKDATVRELCSLCRGMSKEQEDEIIYNGRKRKARLLAEWWDTHKKEDEKRLKKEILGYGS